MSEYYFRWLFLIVAVCAVGLLTRTNFFKNLVGKMQEVEPLDVKKSRLDNGMYVYDFESDGQKVKLLVYQGVAQQLTFDRICECKK
ncbi:hypothetical protein [Pseudoalteromonas marina]|uniref:Uncharacterized protein n=1 Tax=Pseudoalteromonas marina TaxID=267375 RepID=A0ABT9FCC8_9GAMM|nr:hypothetical protein [Pseudoalteromonas marina]MDP2564329.1 hypothetical protein [Pseudoalteromonas marina]